MGLVKACWTVLDQGVALLYPCAVLAQNIRALRLAKGLTQDDLAKLLGLSGKSAVAQWESGATQPRSSLLPRLAEILGVTVGDLFAEAA